MDCSRVVGVIDLLGGLAVAAIGGQRDKYQPIGGSICGDPGRWADCLIHAGVAGIYIADLDSIVSGVASDLSFAETRATHLPIWIDAGECRPSRCRLTRGGKTNFIAASEAFDFTQLSKLDPAAISMDYRGDQFIGDDEAAWWAFAKSYLGTIFLIDLLAVGTGNVAVVERVKRLRDVGFDGQLIAGGGVRNDADINRLTDAGCDLVMVGTALHD